MKLRGDLMLARALLGTLRRLRIVRLDVEPAVENEVYLVEAGWTWAMIVEPETVRRDVTSHFLFGQIEFGP